MKIVMTDGATVNPGDLSWDGIRALGEVRIYENIEYTEEKVIETVGDADIIIANEAYISRRVLDACPNVKYITVMATGYNCVDMDACKERGIPVSNVPVYGTKSVAQFTIGLLLEICMHIGYHDRRVHEGAWEAHGQWTFWDYPSVELDGKTLGLIGFGNIGQQTARIASALGMRILAYNRSRSETGAALAEYVDLDTLLHESDVVSLHMPLSSENKGFFNKDLICKMKDGAIFLNTARGGLVNEQDLADALASGKLRGAGLDVVSSEPITAANPLLSAPNCIITPHNAWSAVEARQRIVDTTEANIRAYLNGTPQNLVH